MRPGCVSIFKSDGSGEGIGVMQHTERPIWCARAPCHGWWEAMWPHNSINEENAGMKEETSDVKPNHRKCFIKMQSKLYPSVFPCWNHLLSACTCKSDWTIFACTEKREQEREWLTWPWSRRVCNVCQQGQQLTFLLASSVHPIHQPNTKHKTKEVYKKVLEAVTSLTVRQQIMKRRGKLWKAALATPFCRKWLLLSLPRTLT